jgi:BirA family transcriptional regulator, biotin operon repressor / biotin---[acetyl-CoA-carboxylase] ligase
MNRKSISDVSNPWAAASIFYKETTSSTMDDARILVDEGATNGTAVCAGYQTKGRARFGERSWISDRDKNLLFTLILENKAIQFSVSRLPLICGLVVALRLEKLYGLKTLVKWPNDVLVNGKKISGILCDSYKEHILIGIGINCNQISFSGALEKSSTSIILLAGSIVSIPDLFEAILFDLHSLLSGNTRLDALVDRLAYRGKHVKLVLGHPHTENYTVNEGIVIGLAEDGGLIVRNPITGAEQTIYSGEISIRQE